MHLLKGFYRLTAFRFDNPPPVRNRMMVGSWEVQKELFWQEVRSLATMDPIQRGSVDDTSTSFPIEAQTTRRRPALCVVRSYVGSLGFGMLIGPSFDFGIIYLYNVFVNQFINNFYEFISCYSEKFAYPQKGFAYIHTPLRGRVTHFDTAWHCSYRSDVL